MYARPRTLTPHPPTPNPHPHPTSRRSSAPRSFPPPALPHRHHLPPPSRPPLPTTTAAATADNNLAPPLAPPSPPSSPLATAHDGIPGWIPGPTHDATLAAMSAPDPRTPVRVAILGDLHFNAKEENTYFAEAQAQIATILATPPPSPSTDPRMISSSSSPSSSPSHVSRIVQLGDLGGPKDGPGTPALFQRARDFVRGMGTVGADGDGWTPTPSLFITGNHDLEDPSCESDAENLAQWQRVFEQRHAWVVDVGPVTMLGLSTVSYRSNPGSHYEVYVDDAQMAWFEAEIARAKRRGNRPMVIFSHAPPCGSGLRVVQHLHIKNRCCWLNHSRDPLRFQRLVARNPHIRLWFSGHFHLSHNYRESVSCTGHCTFVQTGVMGGCHRDGFRQSRFLSLDEHGYRIETLDHDDGSLRTDAMQAWDDPGPTEHLLREEEQVNGQR